MTKSVSIRIAILLFFAGLLTCTWDLFLTRELAGFTLKAHQGLFLSALLFALGGRKSEGFAALKRLALTPFSLAILFLALYYAATAPWSYFPLKSFLYAGWIVFNLATIWFTGVLLAPYLARRRLAAMAVTAALIQACIIVIDQIAYAKGYTNGLIGFNQDSILHWGVSRPHGFSNEPSYAASFLCLSLLIACGWFQLLRFSWKCLPPLLVIGFALFATTSRTGWLSFFLGLALFVFLGAWKRGISLWRPFALFVLIAAGAAGIFALSVPAAQKAGLYQQLVGSVLQGKDGSGNARLRALTYSWPMAKETHFLGTGLGASYKYWISTHESPETAIEGAFTDQSYGKEVVMSIWGQLLAEGGPLAVLLYGAAACFLVSGLWRAWRASGDPLVLGSLSGALVFFFLIAFLLGNVARGDVWVWFAVWTRMAMRDTPEEKASAPTTT
jgi:O-antigen ligase